MKSAVKTNPKKVVAVGSMTGSVEAIAPVILRMKKTGANVFSVSEKKVADTFRRFNIEPDRILDLDSNPAKIAGRLAEIVSLANPSSVLAGTNAQTIKNPVVLDHLAYAIGKRNGIPTVAVMDSWVNYVPRFSDLDYEDKTNPLKVKEKGKLVHLPKFIAIMDDYAEREMIELGFSPEILRITGNPYFDHVAEMKRNMPADAKEKILSKEVFVKAGFRPREKLVVFISDPVPAHPNIGYTCAGVLELFLRQMNLISLLRKNNKLEKVNVIVRPHPVRKDVEEEVAAGISTPHIGKIVHNPNSLGPSHPDYYTIEEILMISDLCVGTVNNPLATARVLEIPAISFQPNLKGKDYQGYTNERGITTGVVTEYSFMTNAVSALSGQLNQEPMSFVEGATERVIELLV